MTSLSRHQSVYGLVTLVIQLCGSCSSPFSSLVLLPNMSEKRKSTPRRAIQMKNRRKAMNVGEKLDVRSRLEKRVRIFSYSVMVGTLVLLRTIRDNADRVTESAKSGNEVFFCISNTTVISE